MANLSIDLTIMLAFTSSSNLSSAVLIEKVSIDAGSLLDPSLPRSRSTTYFVDDKVEVLGRAVGLQEYNP